MRIQALDGDIGKCKDVYFDERNWEVRYFVVELGSWFSGTDVLVPPEAVSPFDGVSMKVELTKEELRGCPDTDSAMPVSLQRQNHERSLYSLACSAATGMNGWLLVVPPVSEISDDIASDDPHLVSCRDICSYDLVASDGDVGAIQDVLIDDCSWNIRFVVASTGISGPAERLYGLHLIDSIEWPSSVIRIAVNCDRAFTEPCFDRTKHLDISYEILVNDIYDTEYEEKGYLMRVM